jgi:hypothetical protein
MGRVYDEIDERLRTWIARQPLFFVGTAPTAGDGHVNVSPKGPIGSFRVLGPRSVAYLDLVGSGAETIAHLRENGRIVIMFCAFEGPPRIVRLHGIGQVLTPRDPQFEEFVDRFEQPENEQSRRAVITAELTRIADSCGYGVPLMDCRGRRPHMDAWVSKKLRVGGPDALEIYQREKNSLSLDGLPALEVERRTAPGAPEPAPAARTPRA